MNWAGISNENEFYSEHYLSEVFTGDIAEVIAQWQAAETTAREAAKARGEAVADEQLAPWNRLARNASAYNQAQSQIERERNPERRVRGQREQVRELLDRTKFGQGRLLRFDWVEIFSRREGETLKAIAVLLHRDALADKQGQSLLDTLEENAHKHAYGVSEDLKRPA